MRVNDYFTGIGLVIDDEINVPDSRVKNLMNQIEKMNIPYISYESIPDEEIVNHLTGISFVLLDWRLEGVTTGNLGEGAENLKLPGGLSESNIETNIDFLKQMKEVAFVPIFIFTDEPLDDVKTELTKNNLYQEGKPNSIFLESKANLVGESTLEESITAWLESTPSIYLLKKWEKEYDKAKKELFWSFYNISPEWPKVLWDCYKEDGANMSQEIGEMVTRNLYSRLLPFNFEESLLCREEGEAIDPVELKAVLEGERFIKSAQLHSDDKHTGDLFFGSIAEREEGTPYYWLNIRAQCDLIRDDNPEMYCIRGKEVKLEGADLKFEKGQFIEKKHQVIIAFLDNGKIIEFNFRNFKIVKWNKLKTKRIGRLLPPYINHIQQSFSIYFQRQGFPRNPTVAFPELV